MGRVDARYIESLSDEVYAQGKASRLGNKRLKDEDLFWIVLANPLVCNPKDKRILK